MAPRIVKTWQIGKLSLEEAHWLIGSNFEPTSEDPESNFISTAQGHIVRIGYPLTTFQTLNDHEELLIKLKFGNNVWLVKTEYYTPEKTIL